MNDPEMYPGTDDPDYTEQFDDFTALRECVEGLDEGLNFVVSWFPSEQEDIAEHGASEFELLIFMPRKSKTTNFTCVVHNGREEIDAWLNDYVKARTMRWYGWEQP